MTTNNAAIGKGFDLATVVPDAAISLQGAEYSASDAASASRKRTDQPLHDQDLKQLLYDSGSHASESVFG